MANLINVYDILKAKYLVLDQNALAVIEEAVSYTHLTLPTR